jgi:hypothetical protein
VKLEGMVSRSKTADSLVEVVAIWEDERHVVVEDRDELELEGVVTVFVDVKVMLTEFGAPL